MLEIICARAFSVRLHDICGQKMNSVETILVFVVVVCVYVFNKSRKQLKLSIYELLCKKWQFYYQSFKKNFAFFGLKGEIQYVQTIYVNVLSPLERLQISSSRIHKKEHDEAYLSMQDYITHEKRVICSRTKS